MQCTDRRKQKWQHIEESVRNIEGMCGLFDGGNAYIAFSLAAETHKVLTTGQNIALFRAGMRFPTISFEYSPRNLAAEHKLIMAEQHAHSDQNPPLYVDFIPISRDGSFPIKWVPFRDWWNRDVIYRASAAPQEPQSVTYRLMSAISCQRTSARPSRGVS